jgi:cell wall-associated NlpC family hydrolase
VSSPQPGDLVFSGAPAHRNGLYAGNGMVWDFPRTGNDARAGLIWSSGVTNGRV